MAAIASQAPADAVAGPTALAAVLALSAATAAAGGYLAVYSLLHRRRLGG